MPSQFIDRTGQRFGNLLVVRRGPSAASGASWVCQCDCGQFITITASNLKAGQTRCRECAAEALAHDLKGQRFGRLVALDRMVGWKESAWQCRCDCGKITVVTPYRLKKGLTQSCGCLAVERASEANTTHGKSGHPVYTAWENMRQRCNNPSHDWYHRYGGRGIAICERWNDSSAFLDDMLPTWEPGLTLDRIDNDGNYEPGNCRWVPQSEQMSNRAGTIRVEAGGERLSVAELARRSGLRPNTIRARLRVGKTGDDLIAPT